MKHRSALFVLLPTLAIAPTAFAQSQNPTGGCTRPDCGIPGSVMRPTSPGPQPRGGNEVQAACTYPGCPEYSGYYCPSNGGCYQDPRFAPASCRGRLLTCY